MSERVDPLVTSAWLAAHLHDAHIRPVDVRWYLGEPGRGRIDYERAHIPGAVFMDIDNDLAAPAFEGPGRHPLPDTATFAEKAGHAGIGPETFVIAYDAAGGAIAARLWWMLRYYGHERVAVLDGGWPAWLAGGYPTEAGAPAIRPQQFLPRPRPDMLVDATEVDRLRNDPRALLLDARAHERYLGRGETIDPRAGHIPGARSAPYAENLTASGHMQSAEALRARFEALGASQAEAIVCYCGSGVTAAHNVLALHLAGYHNARLYVGSWSDWSSDPNRPVATGPEELR